ncbi:fibronectin type III domain-containing protein [Ornithobacterium rhinotracheale]|uniref:fibronectin type III domain-containing protein n=1 Tax=Ornithobacterium rhinotracheale TaxID=28251 RepID=UPI00129C48D0|nr:fibronectin type III domain-containing protein [Ornithobacterium rhinotracheale]MRI62930.1 fibronectin type III domain-containing protein [Ornithobacterium rhinotracheale]MRJ08348.1 fibronectin type III domain-containing protein [Ornithobacterium rhinotracheale]UOH77542.1 fibronectin type III domain-containing protein [Ornithobacterium rhinotracheale]
MKILRFFLFLLLSFQVVNAQENLLPNGDFEQGLDNWYSNKFELNNSGGRGGGKYLSTEYLRFYDYPNVTTKKLKIEDVAGQKIIISFWVSTNTPLDKISVRIGATKDDGNEEYNMEGTSYNTINGFTVEEEDEGWKKLVKELLIPENIAYLNSFKVQIQQSFIKLDDIQISYKEQKATAPKDFKAEEVSQRSANLTWKAQKGKEYVLELNGESFELSEGVNSYKLSNLVPGEQYHAKIWTKDAPELVSEIDFATDAVQIQKEYGRAFPYLENVKNNRVPQNFNYNILDLEGPQISKVKVFFNNVEAQIDEQGNVTLPSFVEGDMKIVVTQTNEKETIINYYNVMIEK